MQQLPDVPEDLRVTFSLSQTPLLFRNKNKWNPKSKWNATETNICNNYSNV